MEEVWNIIKEHATPVLMRSVKYRDMDKEKKNEALRDMTFRVILFLLLPYILSMVLSFSLAIFTGIVINEAVAKSIGSYDSWRKVRRGIVLLSISSVFGASILFALTNTIPTIYSFFGSLVLFRSAL